MTTEVGTKQRLFDAALELYSRFGYYGVSIRDLTDAVGITKASFYNHYKTKDVLVDELFGFFRDSLAKAGPDFVEYEKLMLSMPAEAFLLGGLGMFKNTFSQPLMLKIWKIMNLEQFRDKRARDFLLSIFYHSPVKLAEWVFATMMQLVLIRPGDPSVLATEYQYPISAMLTEYLLLKYDEADTADIEKKMADHIRFFFRNHLLKTDSPL